MTRNTSKRYPAYQDSGVDWLGKIPAHWDLAKVKRLFRVVNGSTPVSSVPEYWDGDIVWVTPDDLGRLTFDTIAKGSRNISELGHASCATTLVPRGSLVLSTRAPIGHLAIAGVQLCTNQGCKCLVPRDGDHVRYFYYQLLAARPELRSLGDGSTFRELGSRKLEGVLLTCPSTEEQRAIADFLDRETSKIDALIAKKERLIELLQEKRTALISRAVTKGLDPNAPMKDSGIEWLGEIPAHWKTSPLKRLTRCLDGRRVPLNSEERSARSGDYPYWGANGVVDHIDGWLFDEKLVLLGEDGAPFFDPLKDVAFAVRGKIWVNNHIHVLRPAAGVDSFFLAQCLNVVDYAAFIEGSTRDKLTQARMNTIRVQQPGIEEQREIASYLRRKISKLDAAGERVRQAIDTLSECRTALISAAVTGKIDVRETAL